jgi:hypothetical protein
MAGAIGEWNISELTKFVKDLLEKDPPAYLKNIQAEELKITSEVLVEDQITFPNQNIYEVGKPASGVAFQNSWANVGGDWAKATYWRDPMNVVHLSGAIDGGATATAAFTLPPGFRPKGDESFVIPTDLGTATATVAIDGTVTISYSGLPAWFSLAPIRFLSKQS